VVFSRLAALLLEAKFFLGFWAFWLFGF